MANDSTNETPATNAREEAADKSSKSREGAGSRLGAAGGAIASGAAGASGALSRGLSDVREVHRAARQHDRAREELDRMQAALDEDRATLEHRRYVEANYDQIIEQKQMEARAAHEENVQTSSALDEATSERDYLAANLEAMKKKHEAELVPYRELLESAQGRADDTARVMAETKRAVKTAEQQVANATNQRDMQVSAASRAQDNASGRLAKLQDELDRVKGDSGSSLKARSELQSAIAAELAHLDSARDEVGATTTQTQRAVENAQTHLWTQKKSFDVAQRANEEAKAQVSERREELDRLTKRCRAQEDELKEKIEVLDRTIEARTADHEAALDREREAYAIIADAREIRATPTETERLAADIKRQEGQVQAKRESVESLAAAADDLKRTTRTSRMAFIGVCVAVALIVILIIVMVAMPH